MVLFKKDLANRWKKLIFDINLTSRLKKTSDL